MKIAFVNQACDRVLPPHQTSVGLCTYGLTKSLSKHCEVIVYGLQDRHRRVAVTNLRDNNVLFYFLPSAHCDRLLYQGLSKYSQFGCLRSPVSMSHLLFPDYGRRVALELQNQRCDVIHVQQSSQYVPVIRQHNRKAKILLHLHAPMYSQMNRDTIAARLRDVDVVTTVSDFVRSEITQRFPEIADRCETVYNGIDPCDFRADRPSGTTSRDKRILFIGAVSPHSGIHLLLDAFQIVVRRFPNVRLDIIGPPGNYPLEELFDLKDTKSLQTISGFYKKQYFSRLKAKLSLLPADAGTYAARLKAQLSGPVAEKVSFPGPIGDRSELIKQYCEADVFAFPAVCNHGFGLPPLEAMAAGTPVVASRSGAVVETMVDRQTGLLVAKNDALGLAFGLLTLLQNDGLRQTLGKVARQRALSCFTWDLAAEKVYSLYRNLMKRTDERKSLAGYLDESRALAQHH
jgi:glycosyltransferase involved in cell wall biosynthesis